MSGIFGLGVIPVIVTAAVIVIAAVWLVRFITGIKRTNDFYRSRVTEEDDPKNAGKDTDPAESQDHTQK